VAGLRNRPAAQENEPEHESASGTLDIEDTSARAEPEPSDHVDEPAPAGDYATVQDTAYDAGFDHDEDQLDRDQAAESVESVDDDDDDEADEVSPKPAPARRPAGKRRATGTTRPANLREAEAETRTARVRRVREDDSRKRGANRLSVAVVLAVVAVLLAGLAFWFKGEADSLGSGDTNKALTDSAETSEALGQLKSAIETTFSYNYTDLESTQKAVDETLTGKSRCEYDQLFGQVKKLAPKQKIVMVTAVREIALIRLDDDRAQALVFIDQSSTRVDVNNSVAGEAQFAVIAHREGDDWKITEFDMFDQPLVNGQPAPKC
jgi:Mce-associated membrane protein